MKTNQLYQETQKKFDQIINIYYPDSKINLSFDENHIQIMFLNLDGLLMGIIEIHKYTDESIKAYVVNSNSIKSMIDHIKDQEKYFQDIYKFFYLNPIREDIFECFNDYINKFENLK